ncbi:MAG: hypothetical protein M0Z94_16060 [Dehalococcoidales bacterium]|nr:hypothetical protein [Dehalococcoidales bacterium]
MKGEDVETKVALLLVLGSLLLMMLFTGTAATKAQTTPKAGAAIEAAYRAAQTDPGLSDEAKVRAAVDAYFSLNYESRLAGTALDPAFLIDTASSQGSRRSTTSRLPTTTSPYTNRSR